MQFEATELDGVWLIKPKRFSDDRGYFSETFRQDLFEEGIGQKVDFVQDNFSRSNHKGTIRGLHFQAPPFAQGKLVRCARGGIQDVAIDIRKGSQTFGQFVSFELTEKNGHQLWIPEGFLHGFCTLEDYCDVAYKCTQYYSPKCDANVRWDDPKLGVNWVLGSNKAVLSDKDKAAPYFEEFTSPF